MTTELLIGESRISSVKATAGLRPFTARELVAVLLVGGCGGIAVLAKAWLGIPMFLGIPASLFLGYRARSVKCRYLRPKPWIAAGLLGLAAYDLTRIGIVKMFGFDTSPFGAWRLFGSSLSAGLLGDGPSFVLGAAVHVANGLGFTWILWSLSLNPKRVSLIASLVLEALMLISYPQFLGIHSYPSFLAMSLVGHLVFGSVVGQSLARLDAR
jgi:hypothetical protein